MHWLRTTRTGYRLPQIGLVGNLVSARLIMPMLAGYRLPQIGLVGNNNLVPYP